MPLLKWNKRKSKQPAAPTPKRPKSVQSESRGRSSTTRPLSVSSTPGNMHNSRSSLEVGNATEPIPSLSRQSSPSKRLPGFHKKTYLTPDINPVRSRQRKFGKRDSHSSSSEDEFDLRSEAPSLNHAPVEKVSLFLPGGEEGLPVVNIPVRNTPTDPQLSLSTNGTANKKASRHSFRDNPPEIEIDEADRASHSDVNHSGLLSTFMSAAHSAATHIGSIAGAGKHPEVTSISPDVANGSKTTDEVDGAGGSFMQHLDSLLSFSNGKKNAATPTPGPTTEEEDIQDNVSQVSRSNAHDVKFEPLRKTLVSTMGKGELTLEDLGFADVSTNASVGGPTALQIEVNPPTPTTSKVIQEAATSTPLSTDGPLSPKLGPHQGSAALLKPTMSSNHALNKVKSADPQMVTDKSRSLSPPPFRRSLSPNAFKPVETAKKALRRRSQSINTDNASLNADMISFEHPLSRSPSAVELKGVGFANAKRDADFHTIFKKIPKSERLIDDYSCALQREIMVQGRMLINDRILVQGKMYISERHISFKSNILGWVTTLNIPIQEIVQLEKKSTAGLFPNAIVIQTLHQKYIFASLLARDTTFDLITNIWNQLVRGSMDMGDEGVDDTMGRSLSLSSRKPYDSDDSGDEDDDYDYDDTETDIEDLDDVTKETDDNEVLKHAPTEPDHQETSGEVKITEQIIQAPLPKVHRLLFGNDTEFLTSLIGKQKNKNISPIPSFEKSNGTPTRSYHFTKPLNAPVGPKETICQVTETLDHVDFQNYVRCTQTTKTPDVPSGSSFSVVTYIYLSWGPKNSTKVTVYTYMNWTGKSWIKAAIDKGSIDGQKDSIAIMVQELKSKLNTEAPSLSREGSDDATSNLPLIGPKTHAPSNFKPNVASPEVIITEDTLQAPLGTVYSLCFDPSYLKQVLSAQKMIEISDIPPFPESGSKKRTYTYTKPLSGPIGPKSTKCNVTDTVEHFDLDSYIQVSRTISTPDVPSGGSFHVSSNYWLSWGENNSTKIVMSTGVVWKGKSWIKGAIEKGSLDGQKESNQIMMAELKDIIAKDSAASGKKGRKRGKSVKIKSEEEADDASKLIKELSSQSTGYDLGSFFGWSLFKESPLNATFALFILAFLMWVFLKTIAMPMTASVPLSFSGGIGKVIIDGKEYMVYPVASDAVKDENQQLEKEYEIWKWIDSRTQKKNPTDADGTFVDKDKKREAFGAVMKKHKEQDLREMLKIAEDHLEELLSQLDEDQDVKNIIQESL